MRERKRQPSIGDVPTIFLLVPTKLHGRHPLLTRLRDSLSKGISHISGQPPGYNNVYTISAPSTLPLAPIPLQADMMTREVGDGRAPRQPGQVREEAAVTSFGPGRRSSLPPHFPSTLSAREGA